MNLLNCISKYFNQERERERNAMRQRDLIAYQNYKTEPQDVRYDKANSISCVVSCIVG